jgi:excinuclease ABC subunit C
MKKNLFNILGIKNLPHQPGVYQFFDQTKNVIYVGKAKDLKKRVTSYFRGAKDPKTAALVSSINSVEIIVTQNEVEALLLENTLIKKFKPHYNIIFKDDKSYPYLFISEHSFPRLTIHRGPQKYRGEYFGPYPASAIAWETLHILQKVFGLRSCNDHFFSLRTRPCIQYQIQRCTAPCVNYINTDIYQQNVNLVKDFLRGKSKQLIRVLKEKMAKASSLQNYEAAINYRNQLYRLQQITIPQHVVGKKGNVDAIAIAEQNNFACVNILLIRGGDVIDSKNFIIPKGKDNFIYSTEEIIETFIEQYYLIDPKPIPDRILFAQKLTATNRLANAISKKVAHKVIITSGLKVKGNNKSWLEMSARNAAEALALYVNKNIKIESTFAELAKIFNLPKIPKKIECFDVSHISGEFVVASCVVFNEHGPVKSAYHLYNIKGIKPGDDYAALEQALTRRYAKMPPPDLLMIDGGKGQLKIAHGVLAKYHKDLPILGIAKGKERKPGLERFFMLGQKEITLATNSPILHILQQIRDEAHRFAITTHRKQQRKAMQTSQLQKIPGIGPKRRKLLFAQFKDLDGIKNASTEELAKALKISKQKAQEIIKFVTADREQNVNNYKL